MPAPSRTPRDRSDATKRSAVDKAFDVLRQFHDGKTLSLTEVVLLTGFSKTTTHRILKTLVDNQALMRAGEFYRLGPLVDYLTAERFSSHTQLVSEELTPLLAALFERTRRTVQLAVLLDTQVVYVNKLFSARSNLSPSKIGGRAPAYATGVGKVLLAWNKEATARVLREPRPALTKYTLTTEDDLLRCLAAIREDGYGFDRQEIQMGLTCVAAPVFGRDNTPVAAMSVSGASADFRPEHYISDLLKVCSVATKRMKSLSA